MQKLLLFYLLGAIAIGAGFVAGFAVLDVTRIILPPFRPEDDDTLRERVPVAIAYATWGLTSLIVLVVGWHRFRAYSTSAESP